MLELITYSKSRVKKILTLFVLCIVLSLCSSCADKSDVKLPSIEDYYVKTTQSERKELKLGVVTGPYGDMFVETIEPLFAQKGYSVELVLYDNYNEPNFALANGEIDLNMFQHYKYLNDFKFKNDLDLSAIAEIPTVAMGIYSYKYNSIDGLKDGAVVAVPNDSTNLSRALTVLETTGIISINSSIDKTKVAVDDIKRNPKNLKFILIDAPLLAETIDDYDLSVINGNFALSGGLNLSDALFSETLTDGYINVIAVRTEDLGELFVTDLIEVLFSDEFKNEIMDVNGKYSGFQYPLNFMNVAR